MAATPQMQVRERRFASPLSRFAQAKLEPVHWPLYSAIQLAGGGTTIPAETRFFSYAIGQDVAGAGAAVVATENYTNMETAGFLANPKLALVTGMRLYLPPLQDQLDTLAENSLTVGAPNPNPLLADAIRILACTAFRFHVGTKTYFYGPSWFVPANIALGGVAAVALRSGADGAIDASDPSTVGRYKGLPQFPVWIPPQQTFYCALEAPQANRPTLGANSANRVLYTVLDAIMGREVQ